MFMFGISKVSNVTIIVIDIAIRDNVAITKRFLRDSCVLFVAARVILQASFSLVYLCTGFSDILSLTHILRPMMTQTQ